MSRKERRRLAVMEQVREGYLTLVEASDRLGLSVRQAKRIWKRFKDNGATGLVHRSRGMPSNRAQPPQFKEKVLEVFATHYREYGPTLASEVLEEEHGLSVHAETLRRWLHGAHLYVPRRVPRQHRKRRERRPRFGELLQIDGSEHRWFGPDGDKTVLMVAVDDATGRTMGHMGESETTRNAYVLLMAWMRRYGVPQAVYVDRRSAYCEPDREPNAEEIRLGTGPLTDFGRACERLGIEIILARSAEAKGRVERKNGVLQDRLAKFLARRGIEDIAGCNAALGAFMNDLNAKQAKEPTLAVDAHRQSPSDHLLNDICSWQTPRKVARDWTVAYEGRRYQIERQRPMPVPGNEVIVRRRFDGTLAILWRAKELTCTLDGEPLTTKALPAPCRGRAQEARPTGTRQPSSRPLA